MCCRQPCGVQLTADEFGCLPDSNGKPRPIKRYTWLNPNNITVQLIAYGGIITSIKVPDKNGQVEDIVTGFNNVEGYLKPENPYFGATIGRVANRIAGGQMVIEGITYNLPINNGPNHLHGGLKGFDKQIWEDHVSGKRVTLSYHSADGEEGYPGNVVLNASFELTQENVFLMEYKALTTKPNCINLTNHSYFNLAGHYKGETEVYKHLISINADNFTELHENIPTGKILPVSGTVFDLRIPKVLGDIINKVPNSPGFDHNFCVNKGPNEGNSFVAKAVHPESGRVLEVHSNQPGVQFYTGNFLPTDNSLPGKEGFVKKHGAFCFETQLYPDAVNHKNFPKAIIYPGEMYYHTTSFTFLVDPKC